MPYMTSAANFRLPTLTGHVIQFKAGVPTFVPPVAVSEAQKFNIVLATDDQLKENELAAHDTSGHARVQLTGELRDMLIMHTMNDIVEKNDTSEFDAGGKPTVAAIEARSSIKISASERNTLWARLSDLSGEGADLPTHPNLDLIRDIQNLRLKNDMVRIGGTLGVDVSGLKVSEGRDALLAKAIEMHTELGGAAITE